MKIAFFVSLRAERFECILLMLHVNVKQIKSDRIMN